MESREKGGGYKEKKRWRGREKAKKDKKVKKVEKREKKELTRGGRMW